MTGMEQYVTEQQYKALYYQKIYEIYDKDGKKVCFDWNEYNKNSDIISHSFWGSCDTNEVIKLYKTIERANFKHIPNGIYYCSYQGKKIPFLLFQDQTIHQICGVYHSNKKDVYDYYCAVSVADKYMMRDVVHEYIVAMYNNYHYGVGVDIQGARENLERWLFEKYRDVILTAAALPRQKRAK